MRGVMSLVGLLVVLGIGMFVYRSYLTQGTNAGAAGTNNVRAVADISGVKSDLIAMAQAERTYRTLNGKYTSLDDLHSSGDLLVDPSRVRSGYTYSADVSDNQFKITATYSGPATGMPSLSIDDSMQINQQ